MFFYFGEQKTVSKNSFQIGPYGMFEVFEDNS